MAQKPASVRADTAARILLIDDEPNLLSGLEHVLGEAGYDVTATTSSRQGLRSAVEQPPDLIICDVMMPPPDGFEVRALLNADPRTASIPFIFVTARDERSDRLHGLRAGADDYITKPFDLQELLVRIRAVLRRAQLSRTRGRREAEEGLTDRQREVLKNFTHELKTPLSSILLSLQIVMREKYGDDAAESRAFISDAMKSAERLRLLIDDLLFLSAMDQGSVTTYRQSIVPQHHFVEPVRRCLDRWDEKDLDVTIRVDPEVTLYAPRDNFRLAVAHLVDNACKFSPDRGTVTVALERGADGAAVVTVADEGPGIPPEDRERVFERYTQLSRGDARLYQGLGVGLTIARAVARRLGGEVAVLNVPSGCTVEMRIPPGEPDTPEPGADRP